LNYSLETAPAHPGSRIGRLRSILAGSMSQGPRTIPPGKKPVPPTGNSSTPGPERHAQPGPRREEAGVRSHRVAGQSWRRFRPKDLACRKVPRVRCLGVAWKISKKNRACQAGMIAAHHPGSRTPGSISGHFKNPRRAAGVAKGPPRRMKRRGGPLGRVVVSVLFKAGMRRAHKRRCSESAGPGLPTGPGRISGYHPSGRDRANSGRNFSRSAADRR